MSLPFCYWKCPQEAIELLTIIESNRLGLTYNALPDPVSKDEFAAWAKEEYPEEWARLESKGQKETEFQGPVFNITRLFEA